MSINWNPIRRRREPSPRWSGHPDEGVLHFTEMLTRPDSRRIIGVDIGGTKTLAVTADVPHRGQPEVVDRELRPSEASSEAVLDVVLESIGTLIDRSEEKVRGVGVGLAGFVDRSGVVRRAPNSPGLVGLDIVTLAQERFGLPVVVDNDVNCMAVAAHRDAGPHCEDLVAVALGTGIGGGIVLGGHLLRGANGFAGELGHMVVMPGGIECACGVRGCWERYASGSALGRIAREAAVEGRARSLLEAAGSVEAIRGEHVTMLVEHGDTDAEAIFAEWSGFVALGLANIILVLDPQVIVIGGGISEQGARLGELVVAALQADYPTAVEGRNIEIVITDSGPDTGAIGAAVLASHLGVGADN